jgi:hypothetical protein
MLHFPRLEQGTVWEKMPRQWFLIGERGSPADCYGAPSMLCSGPYDISLL